MESNNLGISELLEKLLATGQAYVAKGQAVAEEKLDIPESGEQREIMLDGLKKGAIASAVIVGLFGTRGGRKLTSTALKLGGLAALGTAAYKGYQNWQESKEGAQQIHELSSDDAHERALLLIEAMVAAANADGQIDDAELQIIKNELLEMHLPGEMAIQLENVIANPLSAQELANRVPQGGVAAEVYLATRLIIGNQASVREKAYLNGLVTAMGLQTELVASLEQQIA